jgi:glutaredoxin 3
MSVLMYTTEVCPYCKMAERLLQTKGVTTLTKIRVDLEPGQRTKMIARTQRRTVPQIYIGDTYVGGYEELAALERAGKLDPLLQQTEHHKN